MKLAEKLLEGMVDADDIEPSKAAAALAKKIKKRLDAGDDYDDVFAELTNTRVKKARLRVEVTNALKKMGAKVKHPFEK